MGGFRRAHGVLVDVEVSADDASSKDNEAGRGACALRVTNEPEFVGEKGVQRVAVSNEGGWRIDHNDVLRCWLDVESAAARNDVSLAPGRCYFEAAVWRSPNDLAAGRQKLAPLVADTRKAQDELERALDHNEGDRRLDGSDLIETAKAYGDVAGLVGKRDGARRRQREAEADLRLPATDPPFGRWPGAGARGRPSGPLRRRAPGAGHVAHASAGQYESVARARELAPVEDGQRLGVLDANAEGYRLAHAMDDCEGASVVGCFRWCAPGGSRASLACSRICVQGAAACRRS